jgi:molybdate transport system regulatory protein
MVIGKTAFKLNFKFWIETQDSKGILGEGKWMLLKAIKETGSLTAANEKLGLSYRQTWDNLKKIEKMLGFKIVEKHRGGAHGGNTILTPKGEQLVDFFDRLYDKVNRSIDDTILEMTEDLEKIVK